MGTCSSPHVPTWDTFYRFNASSTATITLQKSDQRVVARRWLVTSTCQWEWNGDSPRKTDGWKPHSLLHNTGLTASPLRGMGRELTPAFRHDSTFHPIPSPLPLRLDFATVACSSQNSELRGSVGLENSPSKFWKVLRPFRMIASSLVMKRSGLFWAQWRVNIWNCLWMVRRVKIIQNGGLKISGKSNVAKRAKSLFQCLFFSLA